jgi:hypothetical protein
MPKRHHHVLPRLYLKGFVEEEGSSFVWEYLKDAGVRTNPQRKSIGRPSATKDYYAYRADDGRTDFEVIENLLERFEKPCNAVFDKIRSYKAISYEDKAAFSFYLTQMHRRVPAYREGLAKLLPKAAVVLEPEVREKFNLPDSQETKDMLDRIFRRTATPEYQARVHLDVLARAQDSRVTAVFLSMKWRFFVAPIEQRFLTCDDPVFYFSALGLLNPASEVSFPISTDVALVASYWTGAEEGFLSATSQLVKELNRRTLSRAIRRVYFYRHDQWILQLLDKQFSQFQSIH